MANLTRCLWCIRLCRPRGDTSLNVANAFPRGLTSLCPYWLERGSSLSC